MYLELSTYILKRLIEVFYIIYCIDYCLVKKVNFIRYRYYFYGAVGILYLFIGRIELNVVYVLLEFLFLIIINISIYFLYEGNIIKKLLIVTAVHGVVSGVDCLLEKIERWTNNILYIERAMNSYNAILPFIMELIILITILQSLFNLLKSQFTIFRKSGIKYNRILSSSIVIYYICLGRYYLYSIPNIRGNRIVYLTLLIIFIIITAGLIEYMINKEVMKELVNVNKLYKQQGDYFKALQESIDKTRKLKHDIGSHINMIQILRTENESLFNKFDSLNEQIETIQNVNSKMLNTLLYYYKEISRKNNIHMKIEYELSRKISISEYDLVTVCKNLLENALEACMNDKENKQKYIVIRLYRIDSYVKIKVENSKSEEQRIPENWGTTKEDTELHGLGLKIIQDICWQYEGKIKYKEENNKFHNIITLKEKFN